MADAMMPVATTTRIISLIMNALLIFALHFARTERADSVARMGQRRLLRGGHRPRKRMCSTVLPQRVPTIALEALNDLFAKHGAPPIA